MNLGPVFTQMCAPFSNSEYFQPIATLTRDSSGALVATEPHPEDAHPDPDRPLSRSDEAALSAQADYYDEEARG